MHTPPTTSLQTAPGGVGLMVGENELSPLGPTAFSVGETAGAEVAEAGVVAVVGVFSVVEVLLHPVAFAITRAAAQAPRAVRRAAEAIPRRGARGAGMAQPRC
jgi:hypothetical protein